MRVRGSTASGLAVAISARPVCAGLQEAPGHFVRAGCQEHVRRGNGKGLQESDALKSLKMQTNCAGVSPGEGAAEATGGTRAKRFFAVVSASASTQRTAVLRSRPARRAVSMAAVSSETRSGEARVPAAW